MPTFFSPKPFDLFAGPLCRFELIETPDDYHFLLDMHHILGDGTSVRQLFSEFAANYDGTTIPLEETTFADYAASEEATFDTPEYAAAAEAYRTRFEGKSMTVPESGTPVNKSGSATNSFFSAKAQIDHAAVDTFCKRANVPPALFFFGTFARTLSLFANERYAVFFTVYHGRKDPAIKRTHGAIVKTLPMLGTIDGALSLRDYFAGFKVHNAGAYPFTHFCRDLGVKPGWGITFQEGTLDYSIHLESGDVNGRFVTSGGSGEMPVIQVIGAGNDFIIEITCAPGRYDADFIQRFADRFVTIANNFTAADANAKLADVPVLDADYPNDRLAYMLEDSGAPVLITTRAIFESKAIPYSGKVLFYEESAKNGAPFFESLATPDTPAYMIYTSGSTGKPKGVVLPNRALGAMIAWFVRDCGLSERSVNASITSFSFDASVPDLFQPLAAGGELRILREDQRTDLRGIHDYAVENGVTGLTTSTQIGLALVNTFPDLPLEYMMLGGEKMVPFAKTPVRMLNGYGPTEFTVCSSYHEVDQSKRYDIPIGRAVPNTASYVVDKLGQPVPEGMAGELALAGPQLANGYWHQPEKTAAAFVAIPSHAICRPPRRCTALATLRAMTQTASLNSSAASTSKSSCAASASRSARSNIRHRRSRAWAQSRLKCATSAARSISCSTMHRQSQSTKAR